MKIQHPKPIRLDVNAADMAKIADLAWYRRVSQRHLIREAIRACIEQNEEEVALAARMREEAP